VEAGGRQAVRDSQQILGVVWSVTVVGKATKIVIARGFTVPLISLNINTDQCKWDTNLRFEVLEKKPIVGFG
jgi:hypothetical protein